MRRKYPDELLHQAADLREQGLTCAEIGRRLGMSASAVDWHCLRLGAESPKATARVDRSIGPSEVRRLGHVVRRFSEDEDAEILRMELRGAKISEIARALGRKPQSVRGRLMSLARREARMEALGAC